MNLFCLPPGKPLLAVVFALSGYTLLCAQDCYKVTNANPGAGDTDLNGYYEQNGTADGCDKYLKVADITGDPGDKSTYGIERRTGSLWAIVRTSDNIMRYFKMTATCDVPADGYTSCCSQGGDPSVQLVSTNSCDQFLLPVELTSFSALLANGVVVLRWETASELNNEGFEVQRSADGKSWQVLAFVPGSGTTPEANSYTDTDARPLPGISYYRLRQLDYDGSSDFSPVRSVRWDAGLDDAFQLYPNPVGATLSGVTTRWPATAFVNDLSGRLIRQFPLEKPSFRLSLSDVTPGLYFVSLLAHDGSLIRRRVVVQSGTVH